MKQDRSSREGCVREASSYSHIWVTLWQISQRNDQHHVALPDHHRLNHLQDQIDSPLVSPREILLCLDCNNTFRLYQDRDERSTCSSWLVFCLKSAGLRMMPVASALVWLQPVPSATGPVLVLVSSVALVLVSSVDRVPVLAVADQVGPLKTKYTQ